MSVVYIAGPMTGYEDFNYPAFVAAAALLCDAGYGVLNPVDAEEHNPTPGMPQSWKWYMRHAIGMVIQADGIALLDGWEKSKGAMLEVQVATGLYMRVAPLAEWLARQDTP